jgi:hypothetical protein
MADAPAQLRSLDDLHQFVHETLCRHEDLVPEQFALRSIPIKKLGVTCGLQFLLHGPRQVRLAAVWEMQQNCVLFYDARGQRFYKQNLPLLANAVDAQVATA